MKTENGWASVDSLNAGTAPSSTSSDDSSAANVNTAAQAPASPQINPATGQPLVGAVDTSGNAYGTAAPQVNPANGLQMIQGGAIDVQGNSFGTTNVTDQN
ncbi:MULTISPECIES: hypothetical protein [unclassified Paraburkholderia]|uniref:hypothetical protein n=1 Tax=unclassified Paraburkholderia TaxID=2615204 RepID=UPI002AB21345|nr:MULTISPECIES: hypothetical protein [unclassified Paraburkholderia]